MSEVIRVSPHVKAVLDEIRDEKDHTSMDSVLREVLRDAGHDV